MLNFSIANGVISSPVSPSGASGQEPISGGAGSSQPQSPHSNAVGWGFFGSSSRRSSASPSRSPAVARRSAPLISGSSSRRGDLQIRMDESEFIHERTGEAPVPASAQSPGAQSGGSEPASRDATKDLVEDDDYKFPASEPCSIRLIPYNPYFPTIEKRLNADVLVTIGRYQRHNQQDDPFNEGIYYRSTVISRKHAVILYKDGQIFLKDTKSLGGTFINSRRLSDAGKESKFFKLYHGDVLQFGVDYRPDAVTGQVRNKDKCCELRVEFPKLAKKKQKGPRPPKWDPTKHPHTECCICLSALYTKQTLFIAACSHTYHYRCIAPLLRGKGFSCPLCRQESDLQESLWSLDEDSDDEKLGSTAGIKDQEKVDITAGNSERGSNPSLHRPATVGASSEGAPEDITTSQDDLQRSDADIDATDRLTQELQEASLSPQNEDTPNQEAQDTPFMQHNYETIVAIQEADKTITQGMTGAKDDKENASKPAAE